jgi:hypothetical protein
VQRAGRLAAAEDGGDHVIERAAIEEVIDRRAHGDALDFGEGLRCEIELPGELEGRDGRRDVAQQLDEA